jgi:IS5 family transposase
LSNGGVCLQRCEKNLAACERSGVEVVCIPQCGGKKTAAREDYEKSREFKKGQRFRAGIEGRISVLFRGRGIPSTFFVPTNPMRR